MDDQLLRYEQCGGASGFYSCKWRDYISPGNGACMVLTHKCTIEVILSCKGQTNFTL